MNKKFICFFIILYSQSVFASEYYSPEWVMYFQNYVVNRQANQSVIFNALNLTDEQRKQFLEITNQDDIYYKSGFEDLLKESYKLQSLKDAKAGYEEIYGQRRVVKSYADGIKKITKYEDKSLKEILTRKQRSKYSMIKKLERHDLKKGLHPPDYYKKNPQMVPFGDLHLDCTINKKP